MKTFGYAAQSASAPLAPFAFERERGRLCRLHGTQQLLKWIQT